MIYFLLSEFFQTLWIFFKMESFRGFRFRNLKGENLCFSNSVTNLLLSSSRINSRIWRHHCFVCQNLYDIINNSSHLSIKSTLPLKSDVARFFPQFRNNNQQVECTQIWNFRNESLWFINPSCCYIIIYTYSPWGGGG